MRQFLLCGQSRRLYAAGNALGTVDLLLTFRGVIGFRWNPEDLGSVFYPARLPLPKVTDSRWKDWTFPLLEVCDSKWLATYKGFPSTDGRKHYYLVAMNDLVDILALPDVVGTWQSRVKPASIPLPR